MSSRLVLRDEQTRKRAIDLLSGLNLDKPWDVSIAPHKTKRSMQQHRLYHLWVGIIAEHTGYSHDEAHELLKAQFLPPKIVDFGGVTKQITASTTKLNVQEMTAYLNQVEAFAGSNLGLMLPRPEDLGR